MADKQLIKQLAIELRWSQADIKRAIDASQDPVTTREEAILCVLRYAGPELRRRNYEIGATGRVNKQQKEIIKSLIDQLTNIRDFYATQLIPSLRSTIDAQAEYIVELLREASGENQGGRNG